MRMTKLQLNALWATTFLFILAAGSLGAFVHLALSGVGDVVLTLLMGKTAAYGGGIVYIARTFAGAPENGKPRRRRPSAT